MKIHINCLIVALAFVFVHSKMHSQLSFSVISPNGNYSITCTYSVVKLFASSNYTASPVSYSWNSPQAGSTIGYSLAVNNPGIYSITATAGSLTASQTLAVGINTAVPTVTATSTPSALTCNAGSVTLIASSTASIIDYFWVTPFPIFVPGIHTYTFMAFMPATYTLSVRDAYNGCVSKTTVSVADDRNYPLLSPSGPYTIACPNGTVAIGPIITGTNTNFNYQWFSSTGAIASVTNTPVLNVNSPDIYRIVVTDPQNGCTVQSFIEVWACTGLNEGNLDDLSIQLFPNPAKDILYLEFLNARPENLKFSIRNYLGQTVLKEQALNTKQEIHLDRFTDGIYFLMIQGDSWQKTFKILKH
jgi:hypothetical protein